MQHPSDAAVTAVELVEVEPDRAADPIAIFLSPRETFALAWILTRFLEAAPRPLTGLQERLLGLSHFLWDNLDPSLTDGLPCGPELSATDSAE